MYEEFIKGDSGPLKSYFSGISPELLEKESLKGAEKLEVFGSVPEEEDLLQGIKEDTLKEAVFTNELVSEKDIVATFKVTVVGRDYTPALEETLRYSQEQANQGIAMETKDIKALFTRNMENNYVESQPKTILVRLTKTYEDKWEMSLKNIESLYAACFTLDTQKAFSAI